MDGVIPYRLEMQAKVKLPPDCGSQEGITSLYEYWGDLLYRELVKEDKVVVNLASKEYSKAVLPHLPKSARFLTCTFGEWKDGRVIEKGTICKMARGEIVRWLAEQNVADPDDIRGFDRLGYTYRKELSERDHYVFVKESTEKQKNRPLLDDF